MNIQIRSFFGPADWGWVTQHVPMKRVEDTCGIIAVDLDTNETVAAAIFDNILRNSVQASLIVSNSIVLRHGFLEAASDYAYSYLNAEWMYALVAEINAKAVRLNKRLGFLEKMRMPDAYGDGIDFIVMSCHRDQFRLWKAGRQMQKVA